MKRRLFLKFGLVAASAPVIVKAELATKTGIANEIVVIKDNQVFFAELQKSMIKQVAGGIGVPYKLIARDYDSVSYKITGNKNDPH